MSIIQVRALRCDSEGCSEALLAASHLDAISARMEGALAGWTYRPPVRRQHSRMGKSVNSADFCPEHSKAKS